METRPYPRDVPPMWFLAGIITMACLHHWLPLATAVPPPWHRLGWVLAALAGALALSAVRQFRDADTNLRPFRPATALVARGPFRWTRNPIYLALLAITLGIAIWLGTASPLAVPAALFFVLDRRFVRREEEFLRQQLGASYEDYRGRVRRWL